MSTRFGGMIEGGDRVSKGYCVTDNPPFNIISFVPRICQKSTANSFKMSSHDVPQVPLDNDINANDQEAKPPLEEKPESDIHGTSINPTLLAGVAAHVEDFEVSILLSLISLLLSKFLGSSSRSRCRQCRGTRDVGAQGS